MPPLRVAEEEIHYRMQRNQLSIMEIQTVSAKGEAMKQNYVHDFRAQSMPSVWLEREGFGWVPQRTGLTPSEAARSRGMSETIPKPMTAGKDRHFLAPERNWRS